MADFDYRWLVPARVKPAWHRALERSPWLRTVRRIGIGIVTTVMVILGLPFFLSIIIYLYARDALYWFLWWRDRKRSESRKH